MYHAFPCWQNKIKLPPPPQKKKKKKKKKDLKPPDDKKPEILLALRAILVQFVIKCRRA